jgi:adenylate cyclase
VSGFCDRCVAAGLPLGAGVLFIDTLHPVYEGRLFRWGTGPTEPPLVEYGRTSPDGLAASGSSPEDVEAAERWRQSPFYTMLQTGDALLRRRLNAATKDEFPVLSDFLASGMTDYVAIINRFAAEHVLGEMDGVYSSWTTRAPDGFSDAQIAALQRIAPYLALASKSVSLARMTGTLMETYLGRDAGQRVLSGRIVRGLPNASTPLSGSAICAGSADHRHGAGARSSLLNDYSDAIVCPVIYFLQKHGGDVLKPDGGDRTLAIFTHGKPRERLRRGGPAAIAAREVSSD